MALPEKLKSVAIKAKQVADETRQPVAIEFTITPYSHSVAYNMGRGNKVKFNHINALEAFLDGLINGEEGTKKAAYIDRLSRLGDEIARLEQERSKIERRIGPLETES